jgi:signal transduction histidine kinase/CheY-like chemotaxis protein
MSGGRLPSWARGRYAAGSGPRAGPRMSKGSPQPKLSPPLRRARALGRANAWLRRFLPDDPPQGDTLRRALVTGAVGCLFTIVSPLYALLIWLFESPPSVYYLLALEAGLGSMGSLVLLRKGRLSAAAWLLLLVGNIAVVTTIVREGGTSQAAGNLVLPVVMAVLLVGWRAALGLGLGSLGLIVTLGVLEQTGTYHPTIVAHEHGVFALVQVGAVTMMLLVFDGVRLGLIQVQLELEAKLAQSHRLEAIGRVAGGVAHDFNNLLTVILGNTSLLAESPSADESVEEIRTAALRGSDLTKQLLAFSRQQKLEPRSFDLAKFVDDERAMFARLIPETIRIEIERPAGAVWTHADPGQISQVALNLVVNARDAMPAGGTLRFTVEAQRDALVTLRVRDTGVGMDPQTLERAFEPFFTTKGAVGTGLGLATVHGIVTQSGGQIRVVSGAGGTEFEVLLPAGQAPAALVHESSGEVPRARPRTILLVEDDAAVRAATTRMLKSLGHEVKACADVAAALATWRESAAAIDLVLSDVVMPGGGGPELLRALPPTARVPFLFMSGYTNDALKDADLARVPFLAKPFTERQLARKLGEVLAASQSD